MIKGMIIVHLTHFGGHISNNRAILSVVYLVITLIRLLLPNGVTSPITNGASRGALTLNLMNGIIDENETVTKMMVCSTVKVLTIYYAC